MAEDKTALPTAITLPWYNTGVSAEILTFLPHHKTCLQKTERPSLTKGTASFAISTQLC